MATNNNCDGSGPCTVGPVKVLSSGGCSNLILCEYCFNHELAWRKQRNKELGNAYQFELPTWESLEEYKG